MKLKVIVLTLILLMSTCVYADVVTAPSVNATPSVTAPQSISYDYCTKIFKIPQEQLFYLTLAGISASKYSIDEIQTENGYIIFKAVNNSYLATIAKVDQSNSILKITPCNNVYVFPPAVILNLYKYIELNIKGE